MHAGYRFQYVERKRDTEQGVVTSIHRCGMEKKPFPQCQGGRGVAYRTFASSFAKALRGD
jgi:hypothetical protein